MCGAGVQAMQRVPRALGEVARVKADGDAMKRAVQGLLAQLASAQTASTQSVAMLAEVDAVKRRMESARETMAEASGLAELMESVEEVRAALNSCAPPRRSVRPFHPSDADSIVNKKLPTSCPPTDTPAPSCLLCLRLPYHLPW